MLLNRKFWKIISLGLLLSACAQRRDLSVLATDPEFTGGVKQENQRPYTQTTDGSDKSLSINKKFQLSANSIEHVQGQQTQIESVHVEPLAKNTHRLTIDLTNRDPLIFYGALPSANATQVQLKREGGNETLTLSCGAEPNCPAVFTATLSAPGVTSTFTFRADKAQARILYLSKHDEFEIKNTFGQHYTALPGFLTYFQKSNPILSSTLEVVFGKSAASLKLPWGGKQICLEADITTTDQGVTPLTAVTLTCGQEYLPRTKIDLVGNNQNGKIALRFNIEERFIFVVYVDLNGKKITTPLMPVEPDMLIPDNGFVAAPVFPMKLDNPRTFNIAKQFYTDMPTATNLNLPLLPEQKYGFEVVQKWIEKWQHDGDIPDNCWGKEMKKVDYRPSLVQFLKKAPAYFAKIKNIFEREDVPANFMFFSLIESPAFYNAKSKIQASGKDAVGPWQLMESVAKDWGLKYFPVVNGVVDPRDERGDFEKSSRAAILQMGRVLAYFGEADYKLAIAAYNQGSGNFLKPFLNSTDIKKYENYYQKYFGQRDNMSKPENYQDRIKKNKADLGPFQKDANVLELVELWKEKIPNYWFLHEFHMMSCETRNYVPKVLGAMIVGENPQTFGF